MELKEFLKHKTTWMKEWYDKHRLLDIDFEAYMYMSHGLSKEEFKELIDKSN